MADATRTVGVYRTSGGDEHVIASSGRIKVESGGTLLLQSGATLTLTGQAVTSTGAGTFNAVTSTGTVTGNSFVSTGGSLTSTGSGVAAKADAFTSTGVGTFDSVTTTGGAAGTIKGLTVTANQGFIPFVEAATSSFATLTAYGLSVVTAATAVTLPLAAPTANVEKWISVRTTAATVTITSSSAGADIGGSTQIAVSTGTKTAPSWIHLIGGTSTSWTVIGQSANVTIS